MVKRPREDHDQRYLAHVRGFAGHIRAGEKDDLLQFGIDQTIIGDKRAAADSGFDDRMAPVANR